MLEASDRLGGRIRSEPRGEVWLNFGAHVFAGAGSATDRLLAETGVAVAPVTGRLAAVAHGGRIAASGRVETYPLRLPLSARSRLALIATPALVARKLARGLPPVTDTAHAAIRYGPYVVGAFLTDETGPMPWDELYALATPGRSFGMLFNTVNALRTPGAARHGGSLMVYAAAGTARALDGLDDDAVRARFAAVGRSRLQPGLTRPLGPVHLAGDYLDTWYTDTACGTAEAAATIRTGLSKP